MLFVDITLFRDNTESLKISSSQEYPMKSKIISGDIKGINEEFSDYLESLSGKKILVTGGNGFIGSYIIDAISEFNNVIREPCKILVLNKNKTTDKSRLSHLINNEEVNFIEQDIGMPFSLPRDINVILHAASISSPTSFLKKPIETVNSNIYGIKNLLEYAKENPLENFVFFSSADVYGNPAPECIPTPETYTGNVDCLNPRSCYSESKRFSETLCSIFHKVYGIPTRILRIGHTYGPGLREDKAIYEFFYKSFKEGIINLKDSGQANISYCYISDTVRGIFNVMSKGNPGEAYNIGSGFPPITIKDLASLIGGAIGNGTLVNSNYLKSDDLSREYVRYLDISKLKKLGFEPKISLEEGIQRLKHHYDEVSFT